MAEELVTLSQAKRHCNIPLDEHDHDDSVRMYLEQAQEIILDYVKQRVDATEATAWAVVVEAWTDETAPRQVLAAILRLTAHLYRDRGDEFPGQRLESELGELPRDVTMFLHRLRDPALA